MIPRLPNPQLRLGLFVASLVLLVLAGCSGLAPEGGGDVTPNSPCGVYPQAVPAFPNGWGPVGTDTTLDVACWNIENFPKAGATTVDHVAEIIATINIDLFTVEEISDTTQFRALLAKLPEYGGFFSSDNYGRGYQKTGVIYRKSVVQVDSVKVPPEFKSHSSYEFAGRPPMDVALTTHSNGITYSFHVIPVHLKAGGTGEDAVRRRAATQLIHDYMDKFALRQPDVDFLVAGDWNDIISEPMNENSFPSFLSDTSDYVFLTTPLVGKSEYQSHPLGLIDNMLVNKNACPDFTKGRITTLRLEQVTSGYRTYVSDHYPVMISTPVFKY